jgi:chromosome segregation protein
MLEQQIAESVQKEYASKQQLEELETVNTERNARIEELEGAYVGKRGEQQEVTGKLTDLKISLGQVSEQRQALKQTIVSLQGQLRANVSAYEAAREEMGTCGRQSLEAQRDILASESSVSELFVEKERRQQSSGVLHKEIDELITERRSAEESLRAGRAEQSRLEEAISELRVELGQLDVRGQDLIARVRDELGLDLEESYRSYQDAEVNWDEVREEMSDLRGKIERLGNVNLDAIDEQDSLEERHRFLSEQVEDLNSSKGQLQQLINRLNKKSREKFAETFELVRENFQQIFRKLFGGGKADIILEDAEDILEAGIEIVARPPGKETRSISLLSGGEKAMTAIALLFSVFKAKPSPFCFLDEVDAALDEANNERFNMLVREFQADSQFIIITHAKRTMSITDQLYGVTMQTRGVSKRISVSFEHYDAEEPAAA